MIPGWGYVSASTPLRGHRLTYAEEQQIRAQLMEKRNERYRQKRKNLAVARRKMDGYCREALKLIQNNQDGLDKRTLFEHVQNKLPESKKIPSMMYWKKTLRRLTLVYPVVTTRNPAQKGSTAKKAWPYLYISKNVISVINRDRKLSLQKQREEAVRKGSEWKVQAGKSVTGKSKTDLTLTAKQKKKARLTLKAKLRKEAYEARKVESTR
jgi:hypothetical protein